MITTVDGDALINAEVTHPCDWCGTWVTVLTEVQIDDEIPEYICCPCVAAVDNTRDIMKAAKNATTDTETG